MPKPVYPWLLFIGFTLSVPAARGLGRPLHPGAGATTQIPAGGSPGMTLGVEALPFASPLCILLGGRFGALDVDAGLIPAGFSRSDGTDEIRVPGSVVVPLGQTHKDVTVVDGDVTINGRVTNNVVVADGNVHVGPRGYVGKSVILAGGELSVDPGGYVHRRLVAFGGGWDRGPENAARNMLGFLGSASTLLFRPLWAIFKLFILFLLSAVVVAFFPHASMNVSGAIYRHPWEALLMGIIGFLATCAVTLVLVLTVIGIPLAALAVMLTFLALGFGWVCVRHTLGRRLSQAFGWRIYSPGTLLLIGLVVLALISHFPVLGILITAGTSAMGLGGIVMVTFGGITWHGRHTWPDLHRFN